MVLFGERWIQMKRIKSCFSKIKALWAKMVRSYFPDLKTSLRTIVVCLLPLLVFFSILSDRRPYNYINFALYGVISAIIVFYVIKFESIKIDRFSLLLLFFNVAILFSQIANGRLLEFPRTIILLSLFSFVIYQFFITLDNKNSIYTSIIVGGLLFVAFFVIYYRSDLIHLSFSDRLGRDFSDQNDLGKNLGIFTTLSLVCFFKSEKIKKWLFLLISLIFFFMVAITGSISNLLCTAIMFIVVLIVCNKKENRLVAIFVILCVAVVAFVIIQLPFASYFKTRIEGIFNSLFTKDVDRKKDNSALSRFGLFIQSLVLFSDRPLLGYGYDQVANYTESFGQFAHNNFGELLACFGIIGLVAFEALLIYPLVMSIKHKNQNTRSIFILLYLFIFQFFLIIFRKKMEFVYLPLAFSLTCFGYSPYYDIKFENKKFILNKCPAFRLENEIETEKNRKRKILFIFDEKSNDSSNAFFKSILNMISKDEYDIGLIILGNQKEFTFDASLDGLSFNEYIAYKHDGDLNISLINKISTTSDHFKPDIINVDEKSFMKVYYSSTWTSYKLVKLLKTDRSGFLYKLANKNKRTHLIAFSQKEIDDLTVKNKDNIHLCSAKEKDKCDENCMNDYLNIFNDNEVVEKEEQQA